MKNFILILLGLFVLAVGTITFVSARTRGELKPLADRILRDLSEGKVSQVYEASSPRFRDDMDLASLEEYVSFRHQTLGAYEGISQTTGAGAAASTEEGSTGQIELVLDYEHGEAAGELHFEKEDGDWKLLRLRVIVPEALLPQADAAQLESIGRDLLDLFVKGQLVALYERFAPELKEAWPAEAYQSQMLAFSEKMGAASAPTFQETAEQEDGYVLARFALPCEKGPAEARLRFFWRDHAWDLLGFAVEEAP